MVPLVCLLLTCAAAAVGAETSSPGLLIFEEHSGVVHPPASPQLRNAEVASVLARVLDLPSPGASSGRGEAGLPTGDIFHRPSAVVVLNVESLSLPSIRGAELPALQALLAANRAYDLDGDDSSLRTLLAGATDGPSVPDSLSARYGGKPLVLCASTGEAAADACAEHSTVSLRDGLSSAAVEIASGGQRTVSTLSLEGTLASPLWRRFTGRGGRFEVEGGVATVALGDTVAAFDLAAAADRALLLELELIATLPQIIAQTPGTAGKLADDTPDFVLLSVSGLRAVAEHHGLDSAEYAMAVALLDSALPELKETLEQLPWQQPLWALVFHEHADAAGRERPHSGQRHLLEAAVAGSVVIRPYAERVAAFGTTEQTWQLQLWTTVFMTFAIFYAASFLFYTDYGRDDAGLYSKYKPKDSWGSEANN